MDDEEPLEARSSFKAGGADDERHVGSKSSGERRRGRPRVTVFSLRQGEGSNWQHRVERALALARLHRWEDYCDDRVISPPYRLERHPDWDLYRAADFAMALMGHAARPLRSDERRCGALPTFNREAGAFIDWLRAELESNWKGRKGPKPSFRKTCKTALSLAVARAYLSSGGRHYREPPTPREIADVWSTLFKEQEPYDSIKNRLPLVGQLCKQFADEHRDRLVDSREYFRKAGDCVLRKLTPKKAKKGRQSTK